MTAVAGVISGRWHRLGGLEGARHGRSDPPAHEGRSATSNFTIGVTVVASVGIYIARDYVDARLWRSSCWAS